MWEGNIPALPNPTPFSHEQGRDIRVARLERERQLERDITARLRGENEQPFSRSRAAEWDEERRALRLRAERAEQTLASEQRALTQLWDE